jgi:AraC-like DNA-binding protein
MNIIPVSSLYEYNYSVDVINALKQFWANNKFFSCIGVPKKTNMLAYLDGVKCEYTLKSGRKIIAPRGSLVYTPIGSEYSMRLFDFESTNSNTVGINFFLFDKDGNDFILDDEIIIFPPQNVKYLIEKIDLSSESLLPSPQIMKAGLYDIFTLLSKKSHVLDKKFKAIEKGIEYLETDVLQSLSVKEIAKICNVSEVYFRRLFKEYSNMSPAEYRLNSRLEKAKDYLVFDSLNTTQIGQLLGFTDTSYFCRQFKRFTGLSPLEYRRQHTTN